ncbi:hypothetical protein [Synechococcus sp. RS9916]|uniref:hypothetical protein n=1 Tax=Synechococcus sp. RS9916 TaxID=221359 RepID=UPI0018DB400C|nr:hypothetical protein [Synechococcus sp. RS9916]
MLALVKLVKVAAAATREMSMSISLEQSGLRVTPQMQFSFNLLVVAVEPLVFQKVHPQPVAEVALQALLP